MIHESLFGHRQPSTFIHQIFAAEIQNVVDQSPTQIDQSGWLVGLLQRKPKNRVSLQLILT